MTDTTGDTIATAVADFATTRDAAGLLLVACGFGDVRIDRQPKGAGFTITYTATDQAGERWAFEVCRADALWKGLGKASVLRHDPTWQPPLILLTTTLPAPGTALAQALRVMRGPDRPVFDAVEILDPASHRRLAEIAAGRARQDR